MSRDEFYEKWKPFYQTDQNKFISDLNSVIASQLSEAGRELPDEPDVFENIFAMANKMVSDKPNYGIKDIVQLCDDCVRWTRTKSQKVIAARDAEMLDLKNHSNELLEDFNKTILEKENEISQLKAQIDKIRNAKPLDNGTGSW